MYMCLCVRAYILDTPMTNDKRRQWIHTTFRAFKDLQLAYSIFVSPREREGGLRSVPIYLFSHAKWQRGTQRGFRRHTTDWIHGNNAYDSLAVASIIFLLLHMAHNLKCIHTAPGTLQHSPLALNIVFEMTKTHGYVSCMWWQQHFKKISRNFTPFGLMSTIYTNCTAIHIAQPTVANRGSQCHTNRIIER